MWGGSLEGTFPWGSKDCACRILLADPKALLLQESKRVWFCFGLEKLWGRAQISVHRLALGNSRNKRSVNGIWPEWMKAVYTEWEWRWWSPPPNSICLWVPWVVHSIYTEVKIAREKLEIYSGTRSEQNVRAPVFVWKGGVSIFNVCIHLSYLLFRIK